MSDELKRCYDIDLLDIDHPLKKDIDLPDINLSMHILKGVGQILGNVHIRGTSRVVELDFTRCSF